MEVFISWSGDRSKACAAALRDWLPKVINAVQPWISSSDIEKGARWGQEVSSKLATTTFGVVCLTTDNLHSDWILFEAGAMSKSLEGARTCTFLLDLTPTDVSFPLAQFQHTRAVREDVLELVRTMNKAVGERGLKEQHLDEAFVVWWPRLEEQFKSIPKAQQLVQKERKDRELLEEILEILRSEARKRERGRGLMHSERKPMYIDQNFDKRKLIASEIGHYISIIREHILDKTEPSLDTEAALFLIHLEAQLGDLATSFYRSQSAASSISKDIVHRMSRTSKKIAISTRSMRLKNNEIGPLASIYHEIELLDVMMKDYVASFQ